MSGTDSVLTLDHLRAMQRELASVTRNANPSFGFGYRAFDFGRSHVISAGPTIIVQDAQQQRRTDIIGYHKYARRVFAKTKTRKQGRKCSAKQYKRMNRHRWIDIPIYAEPTDVLCYRDAYGRDMMIVTPKQKQTLIEQTEERT